MPAAAGDHRQVARVRLAPSLVLLFVVAGAAGGQGDGSHDVASVPSSIAPVASQPVERAAPTAPGRDLSQDESMGGHTLSRHVGRTDGELRERLRVEPQISAASTYTDRGTAEHAVGAAIAEAGRSLEAWTSRRGRRPNLVLDYTDRSGQPLGRSYARGQPSSVPCDRAVVILRWDERRDRYYVLTSYPECRRGTR